MTCLNAVYLSAQRPAGAAIVPRSGKRLLSHAWRCSGAGKWAGPVHRCPQERSQFHSSARSIYAPVTQFSLSFHAKGCLASHRRRRLEHPSPAERVPASAFSLVLYCATCSCALLLWFWTLLETIARFPSSLCSQTICALQIHSNAFIGPGARSNQCPLPYNNFPSDHRRFATRIGHVL